MVIIRLSRRGRKKCPVYNVVVIDKRNVGNGFEQVGYFNPRAKPNEVGSVKLNVERMEYWKERGAKLTRSVANLLKNYLRDRSSSEAVRTSAGQSA